MAATFGTMGGGQFEGRAAARPQVMRELVRLDPSTSFWYMHHPARWMLVNGEWLPWLSKLSADPGVSNVDQGGDTAAAEVAKRRRGWTIIPWDAEPGGYVVAYDGVAGTVHLSKWETPKQVAGQTRIQSDPDGYWAFCKRLVIDGYIDLPDPDFITIQIERQEKVVNEWREKAPSSPFHREALPNEEATLERMRAAMERLYAPPATDDEAPAAPAPKPRRGRA